MASVSENLNIIANVKGEIREMLGASDHLQSYPNAIASAMTDEPIDGEWSGVRPVADGADIKDGVAFVARLKGKTVGGVNSKPEAIVSKGQKIVQMAKYRGDTTTRGIVRALNADGTISFVGARNESGEIAVTANASLTGGHKYLRLFVTDDGKTYSVGTSGFGTAVTFTPSANTSGTYIFFNPALNEAINTNAKYGFYDLTEMGMEDVETIDELIGRLGYASSADLPQFAYGTTESEIGRLDIVLPSIFADGLASAGDIYDEIDYLHNVAIRRVGVAEPIIEPIDAKAWYKVASGGSEEAVCGNGVPLVAEIAYGRDYTETLNDYELANTLI